MTRRLIPLELQVVSTVSAFSLHSNPCFFFVDAEATSGILDYSKNSKI